MNGRKKVKIKTRIVILTVLFFLFTWLIFPFFTGVTVYAQAREEELLLSVFTTKFDKTNLTRSHNISLACKYLNGCQISAGEEFSFNKQVGARTKERGFLDAAVIFQGEFVQGTGGGVCQVSTTLYNAALLSGLTITKARAHSLKVGYVPPSLDAMVSENSDLKILNAKKTPVVIFADAKDGVLTVKIYGKSDGFTYRTESVVVQLLPVPSVAFDEATQEIEKQGSFGVVSESYLVAYRHGKKRSVKRIRKDVYAGIPPKIGKKKENTEGRAFDGDKNDKSPLESHEND